MKNNEKGFGALEILLIVVIVGSIAATGWFVLARQQGKTTSNKADIKTSTTTAPTDDQQVLAALKNYCNANVDQETKKPLVLTVGKIGPDEKTISYSADKKFASVNAVCSVDGTTDFSGAQYILKKVNGTWLYITSGQMENPIATKQFNIPNDFN